MAPWWQHAVVAAVAVAAGAWLLRDRIRKRRADKCGHCALADAVARGPQVRRTGITGPPRDTPSAR